MMQVRYNDGSTDTSSFDNAAEAFAEAEKRMDEDEVESVTVGKPGALMPRTYAEAGPMARQTFRAPKRKQVRRRK